MDETLNALVRQLDLEPLEQNLFRGQSSDVGGQSVFGGQVVGQALAAASRTVDGREPHSLHGYFLLPGDKAAPIVYEVERIRDGRSFSARRVQAIQHGRPIFSMIASFQLPEQGFEHQAPMPEVPPAESLRSFALLREGWMAEAGPIHPQLREALTRSLAIDFRPVEAANPLRPTAAPAVSHVWFKTVERLPPEPMLHRCLLAYASDFNLIGTALRPHGLSWYSGQVIMASLDHALWFHRELRVDEWLLYAMDSPSAQGARGLARGQIFDAAGRLVASVAQEGMMRRRSK
ncbi:MAG: acyl-CoA thioesterase II [Deltaproteobacteria bacterium]